MLKDKQHRDCPRHKVELDVVEHQQMNAVTDQVIQVKDGGTIIEVHQDVFTKEIYFKLPNGKAYSVSVLDLAAPILMLDEINQSKEQE